MLRARRLLLGVQSPLVLRPVGAGVSPAARIPEITGIGQELVVDPLGLRVQRMMTVLVRWSR